MVGNQGMVLVVADQELQRQVLLCHLEKLGYRVDAAASGPEALALLARQHFDMVLMDCEVTGEGGNETTRRLIAPLKAANLLVRGCLDDGTRKLNEVRQTIRGTARV